MASPDGRMTDPSVLTLLGIGLFIAGMGLLLFGLSEMTYITPLSYGRIIVLLMALAVGFAFLVTGFMYNVVARSGEDPEVGEKGLSVTRDPFTGAREWIKLDKVVKATLRPWALSPWIKRRKYYELDLEIKEGDLTIDDKFYVHLGEDGEGFLKRLRESLGDRVTLAAPT